MKQYKNVVQTEIDLDFLDSNAINQRLYFKNLNFLTGKKIIHIKTFNDEQAGSTRGPVIDRTYIQGLGLNLVDMQGKLVIENLSIADLSYVINGFGTQSFESGLPITGRFNFDKSWITCYDNVAIVKGYVLPISFFYE